MFQLVLQFAGWNPGSFDALVALEEELISVIGSRGSVDGHDAGSGEANIFILTELPREILRACIPTLQQSSFTAFAAGYRDLESENYLRLWPPGDESTFTVK